MIKNLIDQYHYSYYVRYIIFQQIKFHIISEDFIVNMAMFVSEDCFFIQ